MLGGCTSRAQKSSCKQVVHFSADGLHLFRLGMNIAVHSHTNIRMTGDLLQGFDVAALTCRIGEVASYETHGRTLASLFVLFS